MKSFLLIASNDYLDQVIWIKLSGSNNLDQFFFSRNFSRFLLQQGRNFSFEIKNVAKTVYFHKKRHFATPIKKSKTFFVKKKSWICRFGIRENMSRKS